tara:strand:- start:260 stop:454 length:195 start_codon:yes stop_codon:yes gene_type:complete
MMEMIKMNMTRRGFFLDGYQGLPGTFDALRHGEREIASFSELCQVDSSLFLRKLPPPHHDLIFS